MGDSSCPLLAETLKPFFSFPLILFASFFFPLFPRMFLALLHPVRLCGADVTGAEECKECGGSESEAEAYAGVSVGGGEEGVAYGWEGLTQYMCVLLSLAASFCVPPLLRTTLLDFYGQSERERKRERANK